ncbi:unnamed protein product [Rotaria sordida]|uniref:Uncharacterized protein n=3 Tax=Rotaria sordida TaxID=392033 RepID=A0A819XRN9_9BILA|nr:unnamed protein product [Rotaria sordida]CAF4144993.1 unnamed protein product [Rotaria sordida]
MQISCVQAVRQYLEDEFDDVVATAATTLLSLVTQYESIVLDCASSLIGELISLFDSMDDLNIAASLMMKYAAKELSILEHSFPLLFERSLLEFDDKILTSLEQTTTLLDKDDRWYLNSSTTNHHHHHQYLAMGFTICHQEAPIEHDRVVVKCCRLATRLLDQLFNMIDFSISTNILQEHLINALNETIYFDEIAPSFTKLKRDLTSFMNECAKQQLCNSQSILSIE